MHSYKSNANSGATYQGGQCKFHGSMYFNNETRALFALTDVYNTLTIHALIILVENETNVTELKGFWQVNCYKIAGLVYSLDDIEHGVLRCESAFLFQNSGFLM